jgi:acyl-coenzyme A thioesterase PaaI-like protein
MNPTLPQKQANSENCFVCGLSNPSGLHLHFYQTAPGEVTAETVLPEHYQGYPGVVHGGIVAAMLDEVSGRSQMGDDFDHPRFMFTARLDVKYCKNVPVGEPIRLVGRAGQTRGRTATASGAIYDADGNLLAQAEALLVNVPAKILDSIDLDALGWRVVPEESEVER